jgi:hypothetical protein
MLTGKKTNDSLWQSLWRSLLAVRMVVESKSAYGPNKYSRASQRMSSREAGEFLRCDRKQIVFAG